MNKLPQAFNVIVNKKILDGLVLPALDILGYDVEWICYAISCVEVRAYKKGFYTSMYPSIKCELIEDALLDYFEVDNERKTKHSTE